MKAIFLDIDGVLLSGSNQKRFEHMAEVSDLAIKLNKELNNGIDYYEMVGGDKEKDNPRYIMKYGLAAVYWDWKEETDKMIEALNLEDGPYHLPASVVTDELKQFKEKWIKDSKHYY